METCKKLKESCQVFNSQGDVRICSWVTEPDTIIGNLIDNEFPEIMHGKKAVRMRKRLAKRDFSRCCSTCPYIVDTKRLDQIMVPYEECEITDYPEKLSISFEQYCNYGCTCCESCFQHGYQNEKEEQKRKYDIIESRIRDALPYVKNISGHGTAELFCSPRVMKLLSEWQPKHRKDECSASIETNGSLFNERNWAKIENLGEYNLSVAITIMSFDNDIYQFLSGTKIPVMNIEDNLRFVGELRKKGVINNLTLATVVQEANIWKLPEFTKRCIEEFGADSVRLRPIYPGGIYDKNIQWFFDIRNPYHPYYPIYKKIMEDPIFENPKVYKWRGELDSSLGPHPAISDKWEVHSVKGKIWSIARNVFPHAMTKDIEKRRHVRLGQPTDEWGGVPKVD